MMKLIESGHCGPRNVHCWRAIEHAAEHWHPKVDGGTLEAHFLDDELEFILRVPGLAPCGAKIDISWIAYADQAERLGKLTEAAFVDMDLELLLQGELQIPQKVA